MTPPYRKKLIEVALPLKAINDESAQENRCSPPLPLCPSSYSLLGLAGAEVGCRSQAVRGL